VSDLVGSIDWVRLGKKFCAILGDSCLAHFEDCIVQATLEDSLK